MNDNRVFVFSTREIEKQAGLFKKTVVTKHDITSVFSPIPFIKFKFKLLEKSEDEIKTAFCEWLKTADLSASETDIRAAIKKVEEEVGEATNIDNNAITSALNKIKGQDHHRIEKYLINTDKYLDLLPTEILTSFTPNTDDFKYWELNTGNTADRIVAVKLLDPNNNIGNKEWIEALKDAFKKNDNTEFYFLLHDNDLKGYEGFDFKVLSKNDKDDKVKVFNHIPENDNTNILVFQHTSNAAVKLLNTDFEENEEKIADEIEAIFYRKPFKDKILGYLDKKFNGDNTNELKTEIDKDYADEKIKKSVSGDIDLQWLYNVYLEASSSYKSDTDRLLAGTGQTDIYTYNSQRIRIKVLSLSDYKESFPLKTREKAGAFFQEELYENKNIENEENHIPTIYISLFDFLDDSKNSKVNYLVPYLPRYKNIIDSSIWNYYVPYYYKNHQGNDFQTRLNKTLKVIYENYKNRFYSLPKSEEYVNLMSRLVKESYLLNKGHGAAVSPFLFHSETKMKESADKVEDEIDKKLSWRFLLVDDEAFVAIDELKERDLKTDTERTEDGKKKVAQKKSKCEIIKNLFPTEKFNFSCNADSECKTKCLCLHKDNPKLDDKINNIEIICVRNNTKAFEKLASTAKFDVILTDYLLSNNAENTAREYSDELLSKIKNVFDTSHKKLNEEQKEWLNHYLKPNIKIDIGKIQGEQDILQKIRGIDDRFWFFFISAYKVAIHERFLEKQFIRHTEFWHIEEGACPVNTPQLFRYLLLSLMKRQIDVITRLEKNTSIKSKQITVIDLLDIIYNGNVRINAIENFNNLLKIRLNYDKIKYDVCWKPSQNGIEQRSDAKNLLEQSPLVRALFPDIHCYDNAFWEHVMHLVYLTAFGTIRQWQDMWEEFMLIKPYLQKAKSEIQIAEAVINGIEEYITSLQHPK